jgi:hypothetical protein
LSFEQMASEFMKLAPPIATEPIAANDTAAALASPAEAASPPNGDPTSAVETIAELERFLDAIHVARAERRN